MSSGTCPQCGRILASAGGICHGCGARQAPPAYAAPPQVESRSSSASARGAVSGGRELCPGCGLQAPRHRTNCKICSTPFPQQRPLSPEVGGDLYWVAVRCSIECRACGHRSPVNFLDLDGSVACLRCGIDQKFELRLWWEAIELAHATGDLAGPSPEGRFPDRAVSIAAINQFATVGCQQTFAEKTAVAPPSIQGSPSSPCLTIQASPGHPLCLRCRVPLLLAGLDEGGMVTRCPQCGEQRQYRLPSGLASKRPGLCGVLAGAHLVGRLEVELEQDRGGATLVKCPNCHAPLDVRGTDSLVHCRYCGAASRISPRALRHLGYQHLEPETWWMLFSGPSAQRRTLVESARHVLGAQVPQGAMGNHGQPRQRDLGVPVAVIVIGGIVLLGGSSILGLIFSGGGGAGSEMPQAVVATSTASPSAAVTPAATAAPEVDPPAPATPPAVHSPMVDLVWNARVTSARGKPLAPGRACSLTVHTDAVRLGRTWLECGDLVLYDSQQSFSGMSRYGGDVLEARPERGDGWVYRLSYSDVGERRGRPQMSVSTASRQIEVRDDNPGGFLVRLNVDSASQRRQGPALHAETVDYGPVQRLFVVSSAHAGAPVSEGAACTLKLQLYGVGADGAACQASMRCGGKVLYDTVKVGAYTPCELDAQGSPRRLTDENPSTKDKDPSFTGNIDDGALAISDDPPRGEWSVTFVPKK